MRPLQPLAGVQGGEHHHVLLLLALGNGGEQGDVARHVQQAFDLGAGRGACGVGHLATGALGHPVAKLQHIAPARGGDFLAVFAVVEVLLVAQVFEPIEQKGLHSLLPQGVARAVFQIVHAAAKLMQLVQCFGGQRSRQHGIEQGRKHALLVLAGKFAQLGQRGVAHAAPGRGDGAQKSRVVVAVGPQAKPGAQVFDFCAVEKAGAARDFVGNAGAAQRFLEGFGLVVGAVEDGKVFPRRGRVGAGTQRDDARYGAFGLVFFAVTVLHAHRLALAQLGKQRFGKQLGVGANHMVGRTQDGAGGAVVLLQLDHLQLRVVLRQALEVVERGAAPAVDALVIVAHSGKARGLAHQQFQQLVLRGVGVLVFIDQHMAQQALPLFAHRVVVLEQAHGQADEVIKIHTLVGREALFIALHEQSDAALVVVLRHGQGAACVPALVFPGADAPLPLACRGHVGRATGAVFQDGGHVIGIEDAEVGLEPQHVAVFAHHAHAQGVEGTHQHFFGAPPNQGSGALAHLGCGLVGEGDGGNAPGRQPLLDQVGNFVCDDPGFARARARQHQAGALGVVNGLELGKIQTGRHGFFCKIIKRSSDF